VFENNVNASTIGQTLNFFGPVFFAVVNNFIGAQFFGLPELLI
jgi:hypothetical protein